MKDATAVATLVHGQLTVCTYGGFAPVCYKNRAGELIGLDVSFLTRFAASLGLAIVTIEKPFDRIWTLPDENECDIAGAGVMQRENRPVGLGGSWSDAYFQVERSLLVRAAEKAAFDGHGTVARKRIVVTRASTADIDAQTRYPHCTIQFVDEVAEDQAGRSGVHRQDAHREPPGRRLGGRRRQQPIPPRQIRQCRRGRLGAGGRSPDQRQDGDLQFHHAQRQLGGARPVERLHREEQGKLRTEGLEPHGGVGGAKNGVRA